MCARRLPVRPDLQQLKHQAKDLLRAVRRGDAEALVEFGAHHPHAPEPTAAKLADAQLALARAYEAPSWPRLVRACELVDAIWRDDLQAVRALVTKHPNLLVEPALVRESNWGPPLSYAANLGRDRIIRMLHGLGATDLEHALDRAALQGRIDTARMLHEMLGGARPPAHLLGGAAYTLSAAGTEFLLSIGAVVQEAEGTGASLVGTVLQTDSRKPAEKHRILELYVEHGLRLPDTPAMAVHRGRIDLLESHLRRDPELLRRTFAYQEIFPPDLGCHEQRLPGTSLDGATLLHVCVEFDELEMARWLLDRGMDADAPAAVDADGFGGHTALFNVAVSYPHFWPNFARGGHDPERGAAFARLLLDRGADPNARASLREQVMAGNPYQPVEVREHRDLTPLGWGDAFHNRMIVSGPALRLIAERGGHS